MSHEKSTSISLEWKRVCDEMDEARAAYCRAAEPVVADREAEAAGLPRATLSTDATAAFVRASDQWALTVAAVNAFARRNLGV